MKKEIEDAVRLGAQLDAGKRKDRITLSEKNRLRLIRKEAKILKKLAAILVTAGGVAAVYALFYNDPRVSEGLTAISKAIGTRLKPLLQRVGILLHRSPPPPKAPGKIPTFFKYLNTVLQPGMRLQFAKNMYRTGWKDLTGF